MRMENGSNVQLSRFSLAALITAVILALLPLANAIGQYDGAAPPPEQLAEGFDSISAAQCEQWLNILAGPGFEGRGTGQEGHVKAAHWVAGKCAEFGLSPVGDADTYFQMLPMSRLFVDAKQSKLIGPKETSIEFEEGVSLERFSNEPLTTGLLAFVRMAGAGAKFEERQLLRGKLVILTTDEETRTMLSVLCSVSGQPPCW